MYFHRDYQRITSFLLLSIILIPTLSSIYLANPIDIVDSLINQNNDEKQTQTFNSPQNPPLLQNFDNLSTQYLFFIDNISSYNPNTILTNFSNSNGQILEGPWEWDDHWGFSGLINNSISNLGSFLDSNVNLQYFTDPDIFTQNAVVKTQLNYVNNFDNYLALNYTSSNASIVFFDTGINLDHPYLSSSNLTFWKDFIDDNPTPFDLNGHGTQVISSIIANDTNFESMPPSTARYNITLNQTYVHNQYFMPDHVNPGTYQIKLASFQNNISDVPNVNISYTLQTTHTDVQLEIFTNGEKINNTLVTEQEGNLQLNLTNSNFEILDVFDIILTYNKTLQQNPTFNIDLNFTISLPQGFYNQSYSGILPQSPYGVLRIADDSGTGKLSYLFEALHWVYNNAENYDITTAELPFAMYATPIPLKMYFTSFLDYIIDESNIFFSIAAGNQGIDGDLNDLILSSQILAVGAINSADKITEYSGLGGNLNQQDTSPSLDLVAPGGSRIPNALSILTPTGELGKQQIPNYNMLSPITGTSFSSAYISGIYHLLLNQLTKVRHNVELSSYIRQYLINLMQLGSSELNTLREANDFTSISEESYSPTLNRGSWDSSEGFGRINPMNLLQIETGNIETSNTSFFNLSASNTEAYGSHVKIFNLTLENKQMYRFNAQINQTIAGNFDFDLYLYQQNPNSYGDPILLQNSTNGIFQDENIYFTNLNDTSQFFLVIKAISGKGEIFLNLTEENVLTAPVLSDASLDVLPNSENNDTLNQYVFRINYTQAENYPASQILLHINETSNTYSLEKSFFDNTFDDGCIYQKEIMFEFPGNYSFYFSAQVGPFNLNYTDSELNHIVVNSIGNQVNFSYYTDFSQNDKKWNYTTDSVEIDDGNTLMTSNAGWNYIQVPHSLENRSYSQSSDDQYWTAMYCGLTESKLTNSYFTIKNSTSGIGTIDPVYSYLTMNDEYNLLSPYIFISSSSTNPEMKIGFRSNLLPEDRFFIQIRSNRNDAWTTLETFSGLVTDWMEVNYNLSDYINSFIQFRFQIEYSSTLIETSAGVMIDYFSVNESNYSPNTHSPMLESIYSEDEIVIPKIAALGTASYHQYQFQIIYTDQDYNYPEDIYLELNTTSGINQINMNNKYGMWFDIPNSFDSMVKKQIIYSISISLFNKEASSFRFVTFDGKYTADTEWQILPNMTDTSSYQNPIFDVSAINSLYYFNNEEVDHLNPWLQISHGWHKVSYYGNSPDTSEIYFGSHNYGGYGLDQEGLWITNPIFLNETKELFLSFSHRLRFDTNGPTENEFGQILISTNFGSSWNELIKYDDATEGVGFHNQRFSLDTFINQNIMLAFYFKSDEIGEQVENSGWRITNITIDYDRTRDYTGPIINLSLIHI